MARTDPRPNYGSKRRVRPDGYIDLYRPGHPLARSDGYVFEHRAVAWERGILTNPLMEVHHRNENRGDNSPGNLVAKWGDKHARDHAEERGEVTNQFGTFLVKPRGQRGSDLYPSQGAVRPERPCSGCDGTISPKRRRDALFCTNNCRVNSWKRDHRSA